MKRTFFDLESSGKRWCKKCGELKAVKEFYKSSKYNGTCKVCAKLYAKNSYKQHTELKKAIHKKYAEKNKGKIREYKREYYAKNKGRYAERTKKYRRKKYLARFGMQVTTTTKTEFGDFEKLVPISDTVIVNDPNGILLDATVFDIRVGDFGYYGFRIYEKKVIYDRP